MTKKQIDLINRRQAWFAKQLKKLGTSWDEFEAEIYAYANPVIFSELFEWAGWPDAVVMGSLDFDMKGRGYYFWSGISDKLPHLWPGSMR